MLQVVTFGLESTTAMVSLGMLMETLSSTPCGQEVIRVILPRIVFEPCTATIYTGVTVNVTNNILTYVSLIPDIERVNKIVSF